MKSHKAVVLATTAVFITLMPLRRLAYADAPLPQNNQIAKPKSAAPIQPYFLTLSLANYLAGRPFNDPYIMLNLVNATHRTLVYDDVPPYNITFVVEYAAMSNPGQRTHWLRLSPAAFLVPPSPETHPKNNGVIDHSETVVVQVEVPPGQRGGGLSLPTGVLMSKPGFYRIKAMMTIKGAAEFDAANGLPAALKTFELTAPSGPLLIRRTATGFVEVPAPTGKPAPAK